MENNTKEQKQAERAKQMENMQRRRVFQFKEVIKKLKDLGFEVVEVEHHQYRINDGLDILPENKMYFDVVKKKRGKIKKVDFMTFIRQHFGLSTNI